jgi:glycosyltransferase involved in cell wall biosynthesis
VPNDRLSIVIRCYNEERHIGRLLFGISQQTIRDVEIIVVDSGSTDSSLSIANQYPVKVVTIESAEFSFGRSLNIGYQHATHDIVVNASAHVYPLYETWLEKLTAPFANPEVALTYGMQRGNQVTKLSEHQIFQQLFPDQAESVPAPPFCNNANAAVRKSIWDKFNFDEKLTGLEDIAWAKRATESGYKIEYVPEARIIHVHEEDKKQIYNRYRREALALKSIFSQDRFNLYDFMRLFMASVTSDIRQALRSQIFLQQYSDIILFRLMQFWGTYRGFSSRPSISKQLMRTFYYPERKKRDTHYNKNLESGRRIVYSYSSTSEGVDENF